MRYFLLREVVFGQDGSFSYDALVSRYNSDLANGLGNLASRTLTMIGKYFRGEVPYPTALSSAHNIGSMLVLTFVLAHVGAVLMRARGMRPPSL